LHPGIKRFATDGPSSCSSVGSTFRVDKRSHLTSGEDDDEAMRVAIFSHLLASWPSWPLISFEVASPWPLVSDGIAVKAATSAERDEDSCCGSGMALNDASGVSSDSSTCVQGVEFRFWNEVFTRGSGFANLGHRRELDSSRSKLVGSVYGLDNPHKCFLGDHTVLCAGKGFKGCIESALSHAQTGTMTGFQVVHDRAKVKVDCLDPGTNATLTCASSIMAWSRPSASSLASMPSSRAVVTKSSIDNLPSSSESNW
jgi:hypothetical protein